MSFTKKSQPEVTPDLLKGGECCNIPISTSFFQVTLWSLKWRSLNPWKGHVKLRKWVTRKNLEGASFNCFCFRIPNTPYTQLGKWTPTCQAFGTWSTLRWSFRISAASRFSIATASDIQLLDCLAFGFGSGGNFHPSKTKKRFEH